MNLTEEEIKELNDRMKKIEGDWIHACNIPTLAHFIYRNNPVVESEYSVEYLRRL